MLNVKKWNEKRQRNFQSDDVIKGIEVQKF